MTAFKARPSWTAEHRRPTCSYETVAANAAVAQAPAGFQAVVWKEPRGRSASVCRCRDPLWCAACSWIRRMPSVFLARLSNVADDARLIALSRLPSTCRADPLYFAGNVQYLDDLRPGR